MGKYRFQIVENFMESARRIERGGQLPPRLSGRWPFVGHLFEMRRDPLALMSRLRKECGEVGTFDLAGHQISLLTGVEAQEAFFRAPDEQLDPAAGSRALKIAGREPCWIHPGDAAARCIADGDVVRLFNDRGACLAGALVTDSVRPGVVVLQTGSWFDPADPGVPGSLEKHGNPNVLTADRGTSSLAQGTSAMSALVQVERVRPQDVPPVSAFAPPPFAPPVPPDAKLPCRDTP